MIKVIEPNLVGGINDEWKKALDSIGMSKCFYRFDCGFRLRLPARRK